MTPVLVYVAEEQQMSHVPPFMRRLQRRFPEKKPDLVKKEEPKMRVPSLSEKTKEWEKKTGKTPVLAEEPPKVSAVPPKAAPKEEPKPDLSSMTKKELLALAEDKGVEVPAKSTKAKLVSLLKKAL